MSIPGSTRSKINGRRIYSKLSDRTPVGGLDRLARAFDLADNAVRKTAKHRSASFPGTRKTGYLASKLNSEQSIAVSEDSQECPDNFRTSSEPGGSRQRQHYPIFKEEVVNSYDYFYIKIEELLERAKNGIITERIIVLFTVDVPRLKLTGSDAQNVTKWSDDCLYLDSLIAKLKTPINENGYFVRVHVGSVVEWLNPCNPYRSDKNLRLTSIPTIIEWTTKRRLFGKAVFDINQLMDILVDETIEGNSRRGQMRFSKLRSANSHHL